MVPKPTPGEWRFTLDFVRLNDYTSDLEGWPITLIRPLFQRLGTRKPNEVDLTAGSPTVFLSLFVALLPQLQPLRYFPIDKGCVCTRVK